MADSPDAVELEEEVSTDLVERIGRGDRGAEQVMGQRYGRGLLYLLKRRTGDAELAADISQDTFRIAIEKLRASELREPQRLGAYLRGIALNLLVAESRKKTRRRTTADSDAVARAADQDPGPFEQLSRAQVKVAVRTLLRELPVARDREILTRTYLEEEDKDAICAALNIDSTHFNRVLFRAKQRFRALVTDRAGKGPRLVK